MTSDKLLVASIFKGWHDYQKILTGVLSMLDEEQLSLTPSPDLRSVEEAATHIIGARARWFYHLMGEGGAEFERYATWDHEGHQVRSASELVQGLERTWEGMQSAVGRWRPIDWEKIWPNDRGGEPLEFTRQWVIWHLIEHDLHHGGEISITLGAHGLDGLSL
jgi:uncharacterized damage-inducible protein DinB